MKKITREEFERLYGDGKAQKLWERIQEAQSSEPMIVDQIEPVLRDVFRERFGGAPPTTEWMDLLLKMAKAVQPLTVQQGFMVERIIRVDGRGGNSLEAYYQDGRSQVFDFVDGEWAPRPAPKTRERTHQEKVHELMKKITIDPIFQSVNKELVDGFCRAAGISLTVTEE